jgi:hypothetical protein
MGEGQIGDDAKVPVGGNSSTDQTSSDRWVAYLAKYESRIRKRASPC